MIKDSYAHKKGEEETESNTTLKMAVEEAKLFVG